MATLSMPEVDKAIYRTTEEADAIFHANLNGRQFEREADDIQSCGNGYPGLNRCYFN